MPRGKVTKFRGSKLFIDLGTTTVSEVITDITATNPGTVTVTATTAKKGDVVTVSGPDGFDGAYVVKAVATDVITLANADWSDLTVPEGPAGTIGIHDFSSNFCELTGFADSGSTINQDDVSTICSGMYNDFEPSSIDPGTLQLDFNAAPAEAIQTKLREYETSLEAFWVKIKLTNAQGTMLYYGSIQTGASLTGDAGTSNLTSGVTIKLSGPKYHIKETV